MQPYPPIPAVDPTFFPKMLTVGRYQIIAREELYPLLGTRVWVEALVGSVGAPRRHFDNPEVPSRFDPSFGLERFDEMTQASPAKRLGLKCVWVNGKAMGFDHVWLHLGPTASQRLSGLKDRVRDQSIRFHATVLPYEGEEGGVKLGLGELCDLEVWQSGKWRLLNRGIERTMRMWEASQFDLIEALEQEKLWVSQSDLVEKLRQSAPTDRTLLQMLTQYGREVPLSEGQVRHIQERLEN